MYKNNNIYNNIMTKEFLEEEIKDIIVKIKCLSDITPDFEIENRYERIKILNETIQRYTELHNTLYKKLYI